MNTSKKTKVATFKIAAPKLKIKTVGYINLYSRRKVEIETKKHVQKVKVYRSRITLKFAQLKEQTINKIV